MIPAGAEAEEAGEQGKEEEGGAGGMRAAPTEEEAAEMGAEGGRAVTRAGSGLAGVRTSGRSRPAEGHLVEPPGGTLASNAADVPVPDGTGDRATPAGSRTARETGGGT